MEDAATDEGDQGGIGGTGAAAVPAGGGSPRPSFAQQWGNSIALVAIVVVGLLVAVWVIQRDHPVRLEVDGIPIANADAVLGQADLIFRQLVAADGAHPPKGAGCWFAPPAKDSSASTGRPRIACGPVRLGVSIGDKVWATGSVQYSRAPSTPPEMLATFAKPSAVEALESGDLRRLDGKRPPGTKDLPVPDNVLRTAEGERLTGEDEAIAAADRSFVRAVDKAEASLPPEPACWFGILAGAADRRSSDGSLYCGPVVLASSAPGATWSKHALSSQPGDLFAIEEITDPRISSVTSTSKLPPGIGPYRPDGRPAPDRIELGPPDAKPQAGGYLDVVEDAPDGLVLDTPRGDGKLNIPSRSLRIDGVARAPKVGSGKTAVVAAPGEELVVARFGRVDAPSTSAPDGSAQIVVGTRRTPFPDWSGLPKAGLIIVSVPAGTVDVGLEVLFEGVPQTLSLVTGERAPDGRAVLYRTTTSVGVGVPVSVSVPLPAGDPAGVSGVVTKATLEAWQPKVGWAPAGRGFLTLTLESWKVNRPCCALSKVEVTSAWALVLPDGTSIQARAQPSASADAVAFEVPDTVTAATARLVVTARFDRNGTPGQAAGALAVVPVELPR